MNPELVATGRNVPDEVNVIIEIPAQSDPIKYEIDKVSGAMFVDRFVATGMRYPCNYGYIPHTLAEDGDPADVLVVTPFPVMIGSVIRVRPIGMLKMKDESGIDNKILAVPVEKIARQYAKVHSKEDLDDILLEQIEHFFEHYKKMEPGKWVEIDCWQDAAAAKQEILDCVSRYET
jgi:inorganic pyrophosphatase